MTSRLTYVLAIGVAAFAGSHSTDAAPEGTATPEADTAQGASSLSGSRPNIIFVITDDHGTADMGFKTGLSLTPTLDRLANEGVHFPNSYAVTSVCTPSRYTALTGQYGSRRDSVSLKRRTTSEGIRMVWFTTTLEKSQPTVVHALKAHGYSTGFVGKFHLNYGYDSAPVPPNSDCKDDAVGSILKSNYANLTAHIEDFGFDSVGAAYMNNAYGNNADDGGYLDNSGCNVHNMEWVADAGVRFIRENKDGPFYLYFAPTLVHMPDPLESLHADPHRSGAGWLPDPLPHVMPTRDEVLRQNREAGFPDSRAGAYWLDLGIKTLVDELEAQGIADNTLIAFFNDHGMDNAGKGTLYAGGVETEVIFYWPGTLDAKQDPRLVANLDFVPTFLDLAGVTPPADMLMDGASLVPALEGRTDPWRERLLLELGVTRALVTEDGWKYLAYRVPPSLAALGGEVFHSGVLDGNAWDVRGIPRMPARANYFDPDQLYNLRDDPMETTNLATANAARLEALKQAARDEFERLRMPGTFPF